MLSTDEIIVVLVILTVWIFIPVFMYDVCVNGPPNRGEVTFYEYIHVVDTRTKDKKRGSGREGYQTDYKKTKL